jgi:hypothetical protein
MDTENTAQSVEVDRRKGNRCWWMGVKGERRSEKSAGKT